MRRSHLRRTVPRGQVTTPAHLVRPMLPMIAVLICTMLIITYVRSLSMWLPRLLGLDP
jgi:TRAP-type C4-dicarboxylate transport system permease large subunit